MNRNTEKLSDLDRKEKLLDFLKGESNDFENVDICIALEKFIFELESIEV